jgi:hypothetical protein
MSHEKLCPVHRGFMAGGTTNLMRANSELFAPPQVVADNYLTSLHNDFRSLPSNMVRHVLFASLVSQKLLAEAETACNSLSRNIL